MKIIFEDKEYDIRVSWYKNNNRLCVLLKNENEEICITINDDKVRIDTSYVSLLDSFISDTPLLKQLIDKKIINGYKKYDFFETVSFDLNILAEYDEKGVRKFLENINNN